MQTLTYKQAFDKITEAYIKGEIEPMDARFCFCGTLSPVSNRWIDLWHIPNEHFYTLEEYTRMEHTLFCGIINNGGALNYNHKTSPYNQKLEDALFAGMCAALDVLKEIHRSRGEDVDGVPEFVKRVVIETN